MDYALNESQEMLRKTARDLLRKAQHKLPGEPDQVDDVYSKGLWKTMSELGWLGLAFPAEYGGSGGDLLDLSILLGELGRSGIPVPFVSTVVCGGITILGTGTPELKKRLLPAISSGSLIVSVACAGDASKSSAIAEAMVPASDGSWALTGTRILVPDADVADWYLWMPVGGDAAPCLVPASGKGIRHHLLKTIALDRQFEVTIAHARVEAGDVLADRDTVARLVSNLGSFAQCAMSVGAMERVLEMAVDYSKQRVQFDRPIGSFQVIQHKLSDMAIDLEGVRWLTYEAAARMSRNLNEETSVSMAKAWASEATKRICLSGVKILGGVGITMDHEMQRFFRKAKAVELSFGDASYHREIVSRQLLGA